jgi:hypothetical protein
LAERYYERLLNRAPDRKEYDVDDYHRRVQCARFKKHRCEVGIQATMLLAQNLDYSAKIHQT